MKKPTRILFFMQLPPPVHGVSTINELIYQLMISNENFRSDLLEIRFTSEFKQLRKVSILKFIRFIRISFMLVFKLIFSPPKLVYFSFMPVGMGFFRDSIWVFIMKIFRKKIILHLHNRGIKREAGKWFMRWMYKSVFRGVSLIHLSDNLAKDEFSRLMPKLWKTFIVPNAVRAIECKQSFQKSPEIIKILFLSNLLPEKGIFLLLDVFSKIAVEGKVELHIAGAAYGNSNEQVRYWLNRNPVAAEKVVQHGPVYHDMKAELFSDSDIFVFPSYFNEECFPLVLLEALSAGLPIVASDIGAVSNIVTPHVNGFLVQPGNKMELKESISKLIEDEELRKKMEYENRNKYNAHYAIDRFERDINNVIREVINSK